MDDIHYQNCLVMAAKYGHYEIVKTLLMFHIDPNQPSSFGESALGNACTMNHEKIVECLLIYKANPNCIVSDCGNSFTPLGKACENSHEGIVKLLLAFNANPNFCVPDCEPKNIFLTFDDDLHFRKSRKSSSVALHIAVKKEDISIVRMLIKHGADVNCPQTVGYRQCGKILLYALENGYNPKSSLKSVVSIEDSVRNRLQLVKLLIDFWCKCKPFVHIQ